jgi:hypothetical protein
MIQTCERGSFHFDRIATGGEEGSIKKITVHLKTTSKTIASSLKHESRIYRSALDHPIDSLFSKGLKSETLGPRANVLTLV